MQIEKTSYQAWSEAYRCVIGAVELVVVSSIGPRILSLRLDGGDNLLYEDAGSFGVGAWKLYGGHRFAIAPESETSYLPDNEPCEARVEPDRLTVRQAPDRAGLQKALVITPAAAGQGFEIEHILANRGSLPWHGAAWAITCVPPKGRVVLSWGAGNHRWRTNAVRYWTRAGERYACPSSKQWQPGSDCFQVKPNGEKGKVGLYSSQGWLALVRPEATFGIRCLKVAPEAAHPDGGCNLEVFTCQKFVELETLGPLTTLYPGQELSHSELWLVSNQTVDEARGESPARLFEACQSL